jgi:hypothetical protein
MSKQLTKFNGHYVELDFSDDLPTGLYMVDGVALTQTELIAVLKDLQDCDDGAPNKAMAALTAMGL